METDDLSLLEITSAPTLVGTHRLSVETMTMARQKALKDAIANLDLKPLIEAVSPILDAASGEGWGAALAEHANTAFVEVLNLFGGAILADLAAVMLDCEANYERLKGKFDFTAPKQGRYAAYLGSDDLRDFVRESITPQQAVHAVREAIRVSSYRDLGKALMGALMGGMSGVTNLAAGTNGTPAEAVPDGATM